jgi:flagellar hook-associated protein 1 FlgK
VGSLTFAVTGLDATSSADAAELKVGDKGILNLTAATAAATTYQKVDIVFDYNSPGAATQSFIFNATALNALAPSPTKDTKINFFTLNDRRDSEFFGRSYDGNVELTTGTLATANPNALPSGTTPAAHFSYYKEPLENSGMVHTVTIDDYWRSIAANVGVKSQEAQRMVKNQEVLLGQLEEKRQSVSGVSMDEEMTNMIKYQQGYNAAARFITTIDEALNTIINGMGIVGR